MLELILSAGLAIVISALCSITEAALYSVPWSFIEQLRKKRHHSGEILYQLRKDVEKPISAVLVLNTIANTAGASIAGAAAVRVYGSQSMGIFVAAFTAAILIFSEILPKTVGVAYARKVAPLMARPLQFLVTALTPVIWITGFLAQKVRPASSVPKTTEDDIKAVVSMTRRSGAIQPYEEQTIRNILSLDQKIVRDIMTPRTVVFSLPSHMSALSANDQEEFWHYSRIPVYETDDVENIVGLVYRGGVLESLTQDRDETKLDELMQPVTFVVDSLTLDKLLNQFLESREHLFVVLDEYGGVAGVVALEDVLEEMLGKEIVDESDQVADLRAFARKRREQLPEE